MEYSKEIKVLDHGYVRYIEHMGKDETVIEAARMSTGRGFVDWDPYKTCTKCGIIQKAVGDLKFGTTFYLDDAPAVEPHEHEWKNEPGDANLLDFLYRHKHMTPFEMGELHIEVQAPIFVFREWHRHRTQSYNEFSARYSAMPNLHYMPPIERFAKQSTDNKQGTGTQLVDYAGEWRQSVEVEQQDIFNNYDGMLRAGVAKEVARINTPVSRYSKMRAKANLRNWLGFLMLRMEGGAQWEIRQYANAVGEIVKDLWPRVYALFEEYDFYATRFSRTEMDVLRGMLEDWGNLSGKSFDGTDWKVQVERWSKDFKGRKRQEFLKKVIG